MTLFNNDLPFHYPQQMQYLYENDKSYDDVCEIVSMVVGDYVETLPNPISPYASRD
ncbi:MAG: hypothetical protein LBC48_03025 [Dysgonamonadaceae bacterium]|jgi:hypothetical protein|nr:hypothetical protein [Dysgonamonadaceae bacterium]